MYAEVNDSLKEQKLLVSLLEKDNLRAAKLLLHADERLKHNDDLRILQVKERNLLLIELSDQLITLRKGFQRELNIRQHIVAHDASINLLDRSSLSKKKVYFIFFIFSFFIFIFISS